MNLEANMERNVKPEAFSSSCDIEAFLKNDVKHSLSRVLRELRNDLYVKIKKEKLVDNFHPSQFSNALRQAQKENEENSWHFSICMLPSFLHIFV